MFAVVTWLFHDDGYLLRTSLWKYFAIPGMILSVGAGFFLLLFTMFDDHLKVQLGRFSQPEKNIFYSFYFIRFVAWTLAIELCTVLYHIVKFSLIPICVFRSMDPEQSLHADFIDNYMLLPKPKILLFD
eukprot:UN34211